MTVLNPKYPRLSSGDTITELAVCLKNAGIFTQTFVTSHTLAVLVACEHNIPTTFVFLPVFICRNNMSLK